MLTTRPFASHLAGLLWLVAGAHGQTPAPLALVAPGQSHFATFETNRVHYLTTGTGSRVVLLVHGWACHSGFWQEQVPALAGQARLILVDLPGHGRSDRPAADYSMDYFARAVLAVLADARVDKATLVGHSMGAAVIARVHGLAPDKVAGLVAIDGMLRRPVFAPDQAEKFVAPFGTPEYRQHAARFVDSMFREPGTDALRDRVRGDMLATPQHVMLSAMKGMFDPAQPDWSLKKTTVPVLVINAQSPMWTADYETFVHSLSPQTDYRTLAGVGHFLMLEKPAEFNPVLLAGLRKFDLVAQ